MTQRCPSVLVVLGADRQLVPAPTERALLVVAGVGTALVLTGGNLYLAHTVAQVKAWRRTLAAAWVLVLAASGGLVLPQPLSDRIACRAGCGRSFVSQQAEIAHLRHCPHRRPGSSTTPAS